MDDDVNGGGIAEILAGIVAVFAGSSRLADEATPEGSPCVAAKGSTWHTLTRTGVRRTGCCVVAGDVAGIVAVFAGNLVFDLALHRLCVNFRVLAVDRSFRSCRNRYRSCRNRCRSCRRCGGRSGCKGSSVAALVELAELPFVERILYETIEIPFS